MYSLIGCSGRILPPLAPTNDTSFPYYTNLQVEDVNKTIILTPYPPQTEPFRENYSIDLIIQNISKKDVKFPLGWGVKIFQFWKSDASWHEVENRTTYLGQAITLSHKGADYSISSFPLSAIPTLVQGKGFQIRIIVSGTTVPDNIVVLAYIDLELQP